ncbi:TRAP transporter large permease [Pseudooceanicola sp. MF1-13]|uniref:TRAP transporter large permease n=1 Tax=Pseudooceanicola sp. MF1-13 TaxID=3379095 RepID=UPI00389202BA
MILGAIGLAVLLLVAFIGVPLGLTMMIVGFGGFAVVRGTDAAIAMVGQTITSNSMSYGFIVVPLFVLMGNFIFRADLARDLYRASYTWFGRYPGGLAMSTIVACGGFSAVSGSSVATAATMGKVAYPEMRRYGYSASISAGTIAAGGTIGILIPPSVVLVLYGLLIEGDIGALFIAGIVPGVLSVLSYLLLIALLCWIKPDLGPRGEVFPMSERLASIKGIWPIMVLFLFVIGGIYFGIFTPTEAGGIGAVGALGFCLLRRRMTWSVFFESIFEAGKMSAMIFTVALGALIFSNFVEIARMPSELEAWVESMNLAPMTVMWLILAIYLVLGCVFDGPAMVLLTVPLFAPLVELLGFDLIWFGIVVVIVTEISMVTPPVGINAFVMKSVLPEVSLGEIFKGIAPFWVADIARLLIIVLYPPVVLYLPTLMG